MAYLYLICAALLFSFVGTLSKNIAPYFGTEYVSFFRFFFGVFFLFMLKVIKHHRFRADYRAMLKKCLFWIIFGAVLKWASYITENYALARGPSYGNIVTMPTQAVFIALVSVFMFKDRMTPVKVLSIACCITGVLLISWNGRSLEAFFGENLVLTLLYVASGICSGSHVLAQKMIADKMDDIDSNLTIFSIAAVLALVPVVPSAAGGSLQGIHPSAMCLFAIPAIGFITGIGFYLNSKAIPLVPFYMVPIITSSMVFFSLTWGILFFNEKITGYTLAGTLIFVSGLITLNILNRKSKAK